MTGESGRRKVQEGLVTSDKMQKTAVVAVSRQVKHPTYGKYVRRTKKFLAQDDFDCGVGDLVRIIETKPLSKLKRWRVVEIVKKAE
jgi:small subunit ribosomal protein S17